MKHSPNRALSPEARLLCLLNLARLSPVGAEEARALAARSDLNWETLRELSELNAVQPLVLRGLEQLGMLDLVPPSYRESLAAAAAIVRQRSEQRVAWSSRLLHALHAAGVEVIVLKGSLFADALYRNRAYKKMNDVDVLIRRDDATQTIAVLKSLGFAGVGDLFGKEELSGSSHHTPPYVSADLGCVVGLHWGLASPRAPFNVDMDGIWRRKVAFTVADAPAFRMSWEDNLLHLCIHLPFFKTGLRELADVLNVALFAEPALDWSAFRQRVREWKAEDAAYRVLALTDALVSLDIPASSWLEMQHEWLPRVSSFTLDDVEKRLGNLELLLRSRSTHVAKIEKAYAVFRLSGQYSERVGAWAVMMGFWVWPKSTELPRLNAGPVEGLASLARARAEAPVKLWNAMAREHGHLALAAMTALNVGIVARETLRRPFVRDGKSLREHPAARLLEVLE